MSTFTDKKSIKSKDELVFAIFCIESIAAKLGISAKRVYSVLAESGILSGYIVPCYDILHTQGKEYIVNDILELMRNEGVEI